MSIVTITKENLLDPSISGTYEAFANKPIAYMFQNPTIPDMISINNVDISNIYELPDIAVLADPDDSNKPILNWDMINKDTGWYIPNSGTSRYLSKFTYLTNIYYTVFGDIDASGNVTLNGLGNGVQITLETNGEDPIVFEEVKLEAQAVKVPCGTIKTYYDGTGIMSIPIS